MPPGLLAVLASDGAPIETFSTKAGSRLWDAATVRADAIDSPEYLGLRASDVGTTPLKGASADWRSDALLAAVPTRVPFELTCIDAAGTGVDS